MGVGVGTGVGTGGDENKRHSEIESEWKSTRHVRTDDAEGKENTGTRVLTPAAFSLLREERNNFFE